MSVDGKRYYKAIIYCQKMRDDDWETIHSMVKMNVAMNGITEPEALILVLENMGVDLDG